ncbi:MAG: hypothetical protein ABIH37_01450 [archaeon]
MVQKIFGLGLGATGTAAILIVGGILVTQFASKSLGNLAIFGGIILALVFGALGVLGILKRLF